MDENRYLDKAINLFKIKGLTLSVEEIATGIGVSKKTLYNRFESKDELIRKCIIRGQQELCLQLECMKDMTKDVRDCLVEGINIMRSFFREMSPMFFQDLINLYPILAKDDHTYGSNYFVSLLEENIERGKSENIYRSQIDSKLMAGYITFSIFAYFRKSVMLDSRYSADYYFEQVLDYNLNALTQP